MITQRYDLDMVPGRQDLKIPLSQHDDNFSLVFNLFASTGEFAIPSGTTAQIVGTLPDGTKYTANATISGKTVTVNGDGSMTAVSGRGSFGIMLMNGEENRLTSSLFFIDVEPSADGR